MGGNRRELSGDGQRPAAPDLVQPAADLPADPPAVLLRRAIAHVETLLQRIGPLAAADSRPQPTVVPLESIAELARTATPPVRPATVDDASDAQTFRHPAIGFERLGMAEGLRARSSPAPERPPVADPESKASVQPTVPPDRPRARAAAEPLSDLSPLLATAESLRIVLRAEDDAGRIRAAASADAERALRDARALADRIVAEARQRAGEIVAGARTEAAAVTLAAQSDGDAIEAALDAAASRARSALTEYRQARSLGRRLGSQG